MKGKIVIAGGTGFIGNYLRQKFEEDGYNVLLITRQGKGVGWEDETAIINALEGSLFLINLAGKPIKNKFTEANKKELISSRVHTTEVLGRAMVQCVHPPLVWFNASGAHIYGTSDHKKHTESDQLDSLFFPAILAQQWEEALSKFSLPNTRKIPLRISIVLGKNGGVLQPYLLLSKFFLGGAQGSGKQKFSWIHIEDFYQILLFVYKQTSIVGPINMCSPEVVDNATLMKTIRTALGVPFGIPAPTLGIKIGASLLGIESDLILKSLSVSPQKLLDVGYEFVYPRLKDAIHNIII